MTTIQLQAKDGCLYYPETMKDWRGKSAPIIVCVYDAGDCDTISWPMKKGEDKNLQRALFDDRESMDDFPLDAEVLLPNGVRFDF